MPPTPQSGGPKTSAPPPHTDPTDHTDPTSPTNPPGTTDPPGPTGRPNPTDHPDHLDGPTHPDDPAQTRASFDALFCSLLDRLYRRAAMLAGSPHAAQDAVHEVYLKLAPRPQRLLAHPEPYAYAFAALLSVVRSGWRRERRQTPVAEIEQTGVEERAGWSWDGGVERRSAELEVVRLLGKLSVRQAGAVVLVDLDGYTIDQAADILGVHRGTVARSRDRALRKLRGSLSRVEGEGQGRDES